MNERDPDIWFPAKRFGYGWRLPVTWQGWVVVVVYLVMIAIGVTRIRPDGGPVLTFAWFVGWTLALMAVCWLKGEPLHWRWNGRPRG